MHFIEFGIKGSSLRFHELPKCGHFEWLDEYIERIGVEVASRELENPSAGEQLGRGNPISDGTTVDAEVKTEMKKMNKQLREIIELKKQDNLMPVFLFL